MLTINDLPRDADMSGPKNIAASVKARQPRQSRSADVNSSGVNGLLST